MHKTAKILIWGLTLFVALFSINDLRLYFIERLPTRFTLSIENGYATTPGKEKPLSQSSIADIELFNKFYASSAYHNGINQLLAKGNTAKVIGKAFRNTAIQQGVKTKEFHPIRYHFEILWIILLAPITFLILELINDRIVTPLLMRRKR